MSRSGLTTEEQIEDMKLDIYNAENNIHTKEFEQARKKKILDVIICFILIVATATFVLRAMGQKAKGEAVDVLGVYLFSIETESMVPTLNVNEVIASKKINANTKLEVGDIITFTNPDGNRVTHRIHDIKTVDGILKYSTKGDSKYNSVDPWWLERKDIVAKFWFKFPSISTR